MWPHIDGKDCFPSVSCTFHISFSQLISIASWVQPGSDKNVKLTATPVQFNQRSQKDAGFTAGQQPRAPRLSAVRYDSVWKLPGEAKLFISMERSVGGQLRVLPAHSAVVWATNCTGRKTLCNHHAIVYSGRVTTATGFRAWAEEPALVGGRKSVVDNPGWP